MVVPETFAVRRPALQTRVCPWPGRTLCVAAFPSWPAGDFVIGAWYCPSAGVDKASLHAGNWLEIGAGHPNKRLMLGQIRHLVSCCAGCAERRGVNRMQQLRPPGGKEKIMGPPAQLVAAGGREVDRRCSQACALTGSTQKPQGSVIVVNHWGDEREPGRAPRSIKRRMGIALEPASKNPAVGSSAIAPSPAPLAPRRPALRCVPAGI